MIKNKTKKVNHRYKCQGCGKPAEVNLQTMYHRWYITPDGEFVGEKEWAGEVQEMWCEKCAEEEEII